MLRCLLNPVLRKSLPISTTFSRAFSISKCLLANYYDVLKINPHASQEEIKEAYFKLSKQNHPDLNQNDPSCHDRFIKLQEAYKVLSNPVSRNEYDMRAIVGGGSRQAFYRKDVLHKPEFLAHCDKWIRQQNERFHTRYNMTLEEFKLFSRRKKIAKLGTPMNSTLVCFFSLVFMIICIIIFESKYVTKLRGQYNEYYMRTHPEMFEGAGNPYYEDLSPESRAKLRKILKEKETKKAIQFDDE